MAHEEQALEWLRELVTAAMGDDDQLYREVFATVVREMTTHVVTDVDQWTREVALRVHAFTGAAAYVIKVLCHLAAEERGITYEEAWQRLATYIGAAVADGG